MALLNWRTLVSLASTIREAFEALVDLLLHPACWPGALWRLGYVIWVCRVAVLSAAAGGCLLAYTVQARDLFADLGIKPLQWGVFFALLFFWAWIVHAEARKALQHDGWVPEAHADALSYERRCELQARYWYPALWVPRLLSFVVFFLAAVAMLRTWWNVRGASEGLPEAAQASRLVWWLLVCTIVTGFVYMITIWKPRKLYDWIVPTPAGAPPKWSHEPPLLAGRPTLAARLRGYQRPTPAVPREAVDWALIVVRCLILALLAYTIFDPHRFAVSWPRLFFLPVLLGGAVVLLGEVAAWSMRWRTPFLLGMVAVAAFLLFWTESFHDTRWIAASVAPSPAAGDKQQIPFEKAVERWMSANKCTASKPDLCPRPMLIAGAGGASRAGFLTASVVGALVDLGPDDSSNATYGNIRSRIFALSTVSGSSAGAAIIRAAFLDAAARKEPTIPPCRRAGTGSWFGYALMATNKGYDPAKSWRDCFQTILAGDFLSPVFVAFAFRDEFPIPMPFTHRPLWPDRAVLLEQAFERRYHRFTAEHDESVSCPDEPTKTDASGLCRPFGYHPDPQTAGAWVPLFFINGTSVFTGRRIVVGDVATTDNDGLGAALMPLAYDLFDVRRQGSKNDSDNDAGEKGANLRLSTAITMSARFPVISPQGILRTLNGERIDQIVDGGYFENDGLATAMDLAVALQHFKLDPVVVRIVNEPSKPDPEADSTKPPPPAPQDRTFFDDTFAIARALVASRSGHEDAYAAWLRSKLEPNRFFEIGVYDLVPPGTAAPGQQALSPQSNPVCRREVTHRATLENVSMSWWMSQPVQAYLDEQLCLSANWDGLERELRDGRGKPGG
jgi:hypothetical protein